MAASELEQLWQDPRHWAGGVVYHCTADPRVIVPRRRRWGGWTLNFAHRSAWLALLAAVVVLVAPIVIIAVIGRWTLASVLTSVVVSVLVVCFAAAWESDRHR